LLYSGQFCLDFAKVAPTLFLQEFDRDVGLFESPEAGQGIALAGRGKGQPFPFLTR